MRGKRPLPARLQNGSTQILHPCTERSPGRIRIASPTNTADPAPPEHGSRIRSADVSRCAPNTDSGPIVYPGSQDRPAILGDQLAKPRLRLSWVLPRAGAAYPLAGIQDMAWTRAVLVTLLATHTMRSIDAEPLWFQDSSAELSHSGAEGRPRCFRVPSCTGPTRCMANAHGGRPRGAVMPGRADRSMRLSATEVWIQQRHAQLSQTCTELCFRSDRLLLPWSTSSGSGCRIVGHGRTPSHQGVGQGRWCYRTGDPLTYKDASTTAEVPATRRKSAGQRAARNASFKNELGFVPGWLTSRAYTTRPSTVNRRTPPGVRGRIWWARVPLTT